MKSNLYRLFLKTNRISGGINFHQEFDFSSSCDKCGFGATPKDVLIIDVSKMGNKEIEQTAHEGFLIISKRIADELVSESITGIQINPVKKKSSKDNSKDFFWINIHNYFPKMEADSPIEIEDLCPNCGRTGYFDKIESQNKSWHYNRFPEKINDFNLTWERFGIWRSKMWPTTQRGVGGQSGIIVTEKVVNIFNKYKKKHVSFILIKHN